MLTAPISALAITGMVNKVMASPIGASDLLVYTSGNSTQADGNGASDLSIIDISSTTPLQTSPIQTFDVTALTGNNNASNSTTLYSNSNGSNGQLALSDNGTEVTFGGYQGANSTSELVQNIHQGAYLTANGAFGTGATYNENSNGTGNGQVRSAYSADGTNYVFADKNGLYTGGAIGANNSTNIRYASGFGGTLYALAQGSGNNSTNSFFTYNTANAVLTAITVPGGNFANGTDFDLLQSGDNGSAYDTLYVASGADILKYDLVGGVLTAEGSSAAISPKVTDLVAVENGNGTVNIYYTEGNSTVEEVTDSDPWNQTIDLGSATTLYTSPTGVDLFGIETAPVAVPEPASIGLLACGLGLIARRTRRRRVQA
jgi:hypothetical protein